MLPVARGLVSTNLSPGVHPVQPIHLAVNYKTIDARLSNRSVQLIKNRSSPRRGSRFTVARIDPGTTKEEHTASFPRGKRGQDFVNI